MVRVLLMLLLACGVARAGEDPVAVLREPGGVGLLRHARAPGVGDPAGFRLGACETQRVLDEAGREQARRIGAGLRRAGVSAQVFSSEWCRTLETAALLGVGPVAAMPALNSFFSDGGAGPGQTEAVRRLIAGWAGGPLVLVTHQVNITALTGIVPADGEMVVVRREGERLRVVGRVLP